MSGSPDDASPDLSANERLDPEATPDRAQQRHAQPAPELRRFIQEAARLLHDLHIEDIRILDVRGISSLTDFIVLGTGTSDRQIQSVGEKLDELGRDLGYKRYGRELDPSTTWLVVDFVDAIVHLFDAPTRAHYDLESLWGDAPQVDWSRSDAGPADER